MKTFFRSFSILALCVALTFVFANHASASETEEVDYAALFAQAQSVTPDTTREYVDALNEAFEANQIAFLDALSDENDHMVSYIVFHWTSGKSIEEIYELRDIVKGIDTYSEYDSIVTALTDEIDVQEYALMMEPYMQYEDFDAPFSVPILRRFIDLNIANETFDTDEAFNHVLATAYETSPTIVAEILCDYSQTDIETLAKCLAADFVKLGKGVPAVEYNLTNESNLDIINLIQEEITNSLNSQLTTETISLEPPTAEIMSTYVPTIGVMNYITAPLVVGQSETLSITFSESSIAYTRQWYVEIYQVVGSTHTLIKAQTIGISPGATSATLNFNLSFTEGCTFYTHVKVYSAQGDTLLASRTGAYPDTVTAYWYIYVDLPSNRNNYGTLRLYDANGQKYLDTVCLGRSASGANQDVFHGNTPTGIYEGWLGPIQEDRAGYGPYQVVMTEGIAGNIYEYKDKRSGIWIHGGRDQSVLQPTNGCVRVFEVDQYSIQEILTSLTTSGGHNTRGYVYISDPDQSYS